MRLPKPTPRFLRKFAAVRMAFWATLMPIIAILHINLQGMALAIMEVSLYANLASDATYWQAARVEVNQDIDVTTGSCPHCGGSLGSSSAESPSPDAAA